MSTKTKELKWQRPIDVKNIELYEEPMKTVIIHYNDSMSHYGVLWQVIEALSRKKFAPSKEIREEWKTLLNSFK